MLLRGAGKEARPQWFRSEQLGHTSPILPSSPLALTISDSPAGPVGPTSCSSPPEPTQVTVGQVSVWRPPGRGSQGGCWERAVGAPPSLLKRPSPRTNLDNERDRFSHVERMGFTAPYLMGNAVLHLQTTNTAVLDVKPRVCHRFPMFACLLCKPPSPYRTPIQTHDRFRGHTYQACRNRPLPLIGLPRFVSLGQPSQHNKALPVAWQVCP